MADSLTISTAPFFGVIDLLVTKTESRFNQEYLSSIKDLQSANGESPAVTRDLKTRLTGKIDPPSSKIHTLASKS